MSKILYKTTRVIYNAHMEQYEVHYRNWIKWHIDKTYKVNQYMPKEQAKQLAIERAEGLLNTVEVWRQSNIDYY